ncbi:MAG TPA: response regulator [Candidatus Paceibacterota bacterium]|nr:response regulator [Candidatus Paceibacterota bacterium]HSA01152.1 response regulator [Candidatus Paceibacterota bacterium]
MVIDDEAAILRLAGEVLRHGGYTVLSAASASEAVQLDQTNHARLRLVLTDIMMPFGDGRHLITMLYEQDPRLPIIAMSGLATPEFQQETPRRGAHAFVRKPFSAEELLRVLASALAQKPG